LALEQQLATNETLLRKLKAVSNEDRDALLQNLAFEDHLPRDGPGHAETRDDADADGSSKLSTMSLEVTSEGSPFISHQK
jgi:hypothetical protein